MAKKRKKTRAYYSILGVCQESFRNPQLTSEQGAFIKDVLDFEVSLKTAKNYVNTLLIYIDKELDPYRSRLPLHISQLQALLPQTGALRRERLKYLSGEGEGYQPMMELQDFRSRGQVRLEIEALNEWLQKTPEIQKEVTKFNFEREFWGILENPQFIFALINEITKNEAALNLLNSALLTGDRNEK